MRLVITAGVLVIFITALSPLTSVRAQTTPAAQQDPWPPAGVHPPNEPGLTAPRKISEVKPQYTLQAQQAGIEGRVLLACVIEADGHVGAVRVMRSLDVVNGLDDEAVKAAKQWTFSPATKNGVAVPVLVTIELTFTLGPRPHAMQAWPDAFAGAETAVAGDDWKRIAVDVNDLRVIARYPDGWIVDPRTVETRALRLQQGSSGGTEMFEIGRPQPARVQLQNALSPELLERFTEGIKERLASSGHAEFRASGRMQIGTRPWIWVDTWVPVTAASAATAPEFARPYVEKMDGARLWAFVTTEGAQQLLVTCGALVPRDQEPDATKRRLESAATTCAAMLKRLEIEPLPK